MKKLFYCDLHIHIGRSEDGKAIKVTGAQDLTFANIAKECCDRKGIDIAGIVDCAAPSVIKDIMRLISSGEMVEQPGGGLRYKDKITVILGSELETVERGGGVAHYVSYFSSFKKLYQFSKTLRRYVSNIDLSSQRCNMPAQKLFEITDSVGGVFIPAHAFTPFKSIYGNCARRLADVFTPYALSKIPAIELGLSADSYLADRIGELKDYSFLANSDAHSLPRIGREYNVLELEAANFDEFMWALRRERGRRVVANFGLDPRLGKYHRTYCPYCDKINEDAPPPVRACQNCGSKDVVKGVLDRIVEIGDYDKPHPPGHRPPYKYQIPLQFVPKVGAITLNKLINRFGSEMAVLHEASLGELGLVVGHEIAHNIILAREGQLKLQAGGGGRYGRAMTEEEDEGQLSLSL